MAGVSLVSEPQTLPLQGHETERMLGDSQFVIGDFVECVILPPLEDRPVMPTIGSTFGPISGPGIIGGEMRASWDSGFGRPSRDAGRGDRIPLGHSSSSAFTNHLPENEYQGDIGGIHITWTPRSVSRLSADARVYGVHHLHLKAATESVVHTSAQRRPQTRAVILF